MGPSEVIDPDVFAWTDVAWPGAGWNDQVLYELHVGTFTREGTWRAAIEQLPALADLGITIIEMMPVADFTGSFGWGYDGVNLFAPTRLYGGPDDLRAFIDAAQGVGLGVILDVVYNHLGPCGNFVPQFAKSYFSSRHTTDWGEAINFDGPDCEPVREYFIANAAYWIREFHFDGLRLDATQNIYDDDPSHEHILTAITRAAIAVASGCRGKEASASRLSARTTVTCRRSGAHTRKLTPRGVSSAPTGSRRATAPAAAVAGVVSGEARSQGPTAFSSARGRRRALSFHRR